MELKDYFRLLRRRWWLLLVCAVLGAAGGAYATSSATKVFGSSLTFFLADAQGRPVNSLVADSAASRFASYTQLASSRPVVQQVLQEAPGPILGVQATGVPGTVFYRLDVRSTSPEAALAVAQAYAGVLPRYITEFEGGSGAGVTLRVFEAPRLNPAQLAPDPQRNLLVGLALGLVLGVLASLLLEALDSRVRSGEDLEASTALPLLAEVPLQHRDESLVLLSRPRSQRAEAVRQVRANLQFADLEQPVRVLLVTSAVAGEGKTSVATDLALACAQAGQRVVLVDADLRRPRLDDLFDAGTRSGLTAVLAGTVSVDEALLQTSEPTLQVLVAGDLPSRPSELLASGAMAQLLRRLSHDSDLVILDTAPLLPVADTVALLPIADAVMLVSRLASTPARQVRAAAERLRSFQARVIGVVANGGTVQNSSYYAPTRSSGRKSDEPAAVRREPGGSRRTGPGDSRGAGASVAAGGGAAEAAAQLPVRPTTDTPVVPAPPRLAEETPASSAGSAAEPVDLDQGHHGDPGTTLLPPHDGSRTAVDWNFFPDAPSGDPVGRSTTD